MAALRRTCVSGPQPGSREGSTGEDRNMANALQERYAELLLDRIRADRSTGSTTMQRMQGLVARWGAWTDGPAATGEESQ